MDLDPLGLSDRLEEHSTITVALVLAALIGGLTAWLQEQAHFAHDEAAVQAEEWTVLASAQRSRADQARGLQIARRQQVRRDRIGADQAAAREAFGRGHRALLALEAKQWGRRARIVELESGRLARQSGAELRDIEAGATQSFPDTHMGMDRTAPCEPLVEVASTGSGTHLGRSPPPGGYPAESRREAFRMEGLRDGAEETAIQAESRFTSYAVSLAVIAVALFLLGYTLTKYIRRYGWALTVVALSLTAGAFVYTLVTRLEAPQKPPAAAAAAYADGRIAREGGRLHIAQADLTCATKLDTHFKAALQQLSAVYENLGTPGGLTGAGESLASPDDLREALAYGQRAYQLDDAYPPAIAAMALALYNRGVDDRDRDDLLQALALDGRARMATPRDPVYALGAGTTRLALGRPWRRSYRQAENLMRGNPEADRYAGATLTNLDRLGASRIRPGIRAAAAAAKEQVVAALAGRERGERGASLRDVRFAVTPVSVGVGFVAKRFDPARDRLFAAWYRRRRFGWQELPRISGPIGRTDLAPGPRGEYTTAQWSTAHACLRGGAYKVELYVNGRLATVGPVPLDTVRLPRLQHVKLPSVNLGLCRPSERWRPIRGRAAGLGGFERRGLEGREGIVVFDMSDSFTRGPARIAATLVGRSSLPLPRGAVQAGPSSDTAPVGNFAEPTTTVYTYPGGVMILATATTPIGRRLAIAVFGPSAFFASPTHATPSAGQSMLDSLYTYDVNGP